MSQAMNQATSPSMSTPARPEGWSLWLRQAWNVARLEIGRNLVGLRALGLYLVLGFYVFVVTMGTVVHAKLDSNWDPSVADLTQIFAVTFDNAVLRMITFFVCLLVFSRLFRAEIQEGSLHYLFLTPMRRGVLLAGKFFAGLASTVLLLGGAVLISYLLSFSVLGSHGWSQFMFRGPGLSQLFGYLGITLLGVIGYGAFFLAVGLLVRNPIIPAVSFFGWEWLNFLLPPLLKRFSVIHYLQGLVPVPVPKGTLAVLADPIQPWIAVPGLLLFATALVGLSWMRLSKMEISYGEE